MLLLRPCFSSLAWGHHYEIHLHNSSLLFSLACPNQRVQNRINNQSRLELSGGQTYSDSRSKALSLDSLYSLYSILYSIPKTNMGCCCDLHSVRNQGVPWIQHSNPNRTQICINDSTVKPLFILKSLKIMRAGRKTITLHKNL